MQRRVDLFEPKVNVFVISDGDLINLGLNDIHFTQTPMPFRKLGYPQSIQIVQ